MEISVVDWHKYLVTSEEDIRMKLRKSNVKIINEAYRNIYTGLVGIFADHTYNDLSIGKLYEMNHIVHLVLVPFATYSIIESRPKYDEFEWDKKNNEIK